LLASHRARTISAGSPITVERDNDKNPVIALREIAEKSVSAEDVKEDLIHSMQKYVEVDEPEPDAVPPIGIEEMAPPVIGQDEEAEDTNIDRMSEEELLKGLESLGPAESSSAGPRSR